MEERDTIAANANEALYALEQTARSALAECDRLALQHKVGMALSDEQIKYTLLCSRSMLANVLNLVAAFRETAQQARDIHRLYEREHETLMRLAAQQGLTPPRAPN